MSREFVDRCLGLKRLLDGLPPEKAARILSKGLAADASAESLSREAAAAGIEPRVVELLVAISRLAPEGVPALARGSSESLTAEQVAALAPVVARFSQQLQQGDRQAVAGLLSRLAARATSGPPVPFLRRAVRTLFLAGPTGVTQKSLAGVLAAGARLSRDDLLLARIDLLLWQSGPAGMTRALGSYLASNTEELELLVTRGSRGSSLDRWRAAALVGCLAHSSGDLPMPEQELVQLVLLLLRDETVRVWRAAASSLGRLACHLPLAREAVQQSLSPKQSIHLRRHAAAALGGLHAAAPQLVQQACEQLFKRGTDPWLIGSVALSLPDLARRDLDFFSDLVERLVKAPGPAACLNLCLVIGDLARAGNSAAVELAGPRGLEAVESLVIRDPGMAAMRWAALDALSRAGLAEAPPAMGGRAAATATGLLEARECKQVAERFNQALDRGWTQLRRVDEVDTSVGLAGRGRLLFEIRDLCQALFEDDLLFSTLRALPAGEKRRADTLAADYQHLRKDARARLVRGAGSLDSLDRFRRTEVVRGLTLALDGRVSLAGEHLARLRDGPSTASRLLGLEQLAELLLRPERPVRKFASSGLARLLDGVGHVRPAALLDAVLLLLAKVKNPGRLADVARFAGDPARPLVQAASAGAQSWADGPDPHGSVTVEVFRKLHAAAPVSPLGSALADLAEVIEALGAMDTVEALGTPLRDGGPPPLAMLADSLEPLALATNGFHGLLGELMADHQSDEADLMRRQLQQSRQRAESLCAQVGQLERILSGQALKHAEADEPRARLKLAQELEGSAAELLVRLERGLSLPISRAVSNAMESWRSALEGELAAASKATAAQQLKREDLATMLVGTGPGPRPPRDDLAVPVTLGPGQLLGDFELLQVIGQGGMGVVFKARQVSLDRFVALKMLNTSLAGDEEVVERFRREAQVMARWSHDNILRIIDFSEGDPCPFLVTEFVEGKPLDRLIVEDKISVERALEIGQALSRGLVHAHEAGVVHRDISPNNVLVRVDGQVLLMDFGIALLMDKPRLTVPNAFFGKPPYMSPEQLMATRGVGPAADIYSMGVVLYELLSSKLPFVGDTPQKLFGQKMKGDLAPLQSLCGALPAELCQLVHKMMANDPKDRPTAREVGRSLGRIAEQVAVPVGQQRPLTHQQVCVVCLQLTNVGAFTEPVWIQGLLTQWYRIARKGIENNGGVADRHLSDRVYGYFGVSEPAADDAARALRAAQMVSAAVQRLAQKSGVPMAVRAGLARDRAVVGRADSVSPPLMVAGSVVTLAEALARSDVDSAEIRVDDEVYRQTAGTFSFLPRVVRDQGCGRIHLLEPRKG